jgi:Na+/H+ antiporter NhaC
MSRSGGTLALVSSMSRFTKQREHGQVLTWMMGLVVFFDDYANTFLVGSTMRPVTDRLKISREKLAFLVDSTAAPIAGIAFISTWIGVEIGYISDTYERLGMSGDVYSTFLATIPYRFYSLHLLVFVWLIAYSGRDFGPMLKAETRALARGELFRPEAVTANVTENELQANPAGRHLRRNAFLPLAALLGFIVIGLWWTGSNALANVNLEARHLEAAEIPATLWNILGHSSPNRVMFLSAFFASIVAVGTAVSSQALKMREGIDAWVAGAKSMFFPVIILVMAWGVATVCDENHLNTAGFLVEISHGHLSVSWMPTLAFLLAGVVAFATGSSWSTMGLLMPLFISVTYYLLAGLNEAGPNHHLMLATIGAVLAGAIFGDHCSPISDTTVLSSAATRCDHFDHVATQLPYAACVAGVALLLGYVPIGLGIWQPILLLPPGVIVLYLLVQFLGRSVEEQAKHVSSADDAAIGDDLTQHASSDEQSPIDAEASSSL